MKNYLIRIRYFTVFISCVFSTTVYSVQPRWIDNASSNYPEDQYLTATASASELQRAKDRALSNLSKIFEARIREQSTTLSNTEVKQEHAKEQFTRSHKLFQKIQISTDKIINGARIAETWRDNKLHLYYALAVLDRNQASRNLRQEIDRLDEETEIHKTRSQAMSDPLLALASINQALQTQQQRYSLQKMLKVIDARGIGLPSDWNMADLQNTFSKKLSALSIGVAVDNDPLGKLELALKSAMGNAGFPATFNGSDFIMVANLEVQDLGFRQGWYWLRGKLSLRLIENNGKVRGSKQWPLKVSALQQSDAESRLMSQVSSRLNKEIRAALISFAADD